MGKKVDNSRDSPLCSEGNVIEFLRLHPQFLADHPDVLARLTVPHEAGRGVVSLVEKQSQIMRRRIEALESKLEETRHEESNCRDLVENIRRLTLELLGSETPQTLYQKLSDGLLRDYRADKIKLFIFTRFPAPPDSSGIRFKRYNAKIKYLFAGVFNHHRPLCGSLQDEHIKALFDDNTEFIHSTVLVPLKQDRWEGLLALGSHQWNYYHHGVALELLVLLSDVTSSMIDGWLGENGAEGPDVAS